MNSLHESSGKVYMNAIVRNWKISQLLPFEVCSVASKSFPKDNSVKLYLTFKRKLSERIQLAEQASIDLARCNLMTINMF